MGNRFKTDDPDFVNSNVIENNTIYPAVARRLQDVCRAEGLTYRCHSSVTGALLSHLRFLRAMGRRPMAVAAA